MKRKNMTRNALVTSIISMLLCVSMLVGATFAWFTDSVVSGNNVIAAGNLDVELEYWDGTTWVDVSGKSDVLTNTLWEPGVTEVAYLKVTNAGTLALKYQLGINIVSENSGINVAGESFKLSDYIEFGVIEDINVETDAYATREEAVAAVTGAQKISAGYTKASNMESGDELYLALVVYMPETVGNEANYRGTAVPTIELGISLIAAQYTYEEDSFDDQYDADAEFQLLPGKFDITNAEELDTALSAGGVGTALNSFDDAFGKLDSEKEFVLDLNGHSVTGGTVATADVDGGEAAFENTGKLTIKNGAINSDYITVDNKAGLLKLENLTLNTSDILYGFYQRSGETIMNDVDIVAVRGGMNISGGKVTINDGSMSIAGKNSKTGYFFYVHGETTEIVINGGDYMYNDGYRNYGVIYATNEAKVIINGGRFEDGGRSYSAKWIQTFNGATVSIYGGSFQFDPSAFVAEGYQAVKGADGWWTVSTLNAG